VVNRAPDRIWTQKPEAAARVLSTAGRLMPAARREWASATQAELAAIDERGHGGGSSRAVCG